MKYFGNGLSDLHKELNAIIRKPDKLADAKQLFDKEWKRRLNTPITDTGNALSDDEIMALSSQLNMKELMEYRNAVGQRTHKIVASLSADDMRRKVSIQGLEITPQQLIILSIQFSSVGIKANPNFYSSKS